MAELGDALFVEEDVMNFLNGGEHLHKGVAGLPSGNIDDAAAALLLGDSLKVAEKGDSDRPRLQSKEGVRGALESLFERKKVLLMENF